jgi:phenylacetate-CoA ligase
MPELFRPEFETAALVDVRRHQERAWARQWDYVRSASALYAEKLSRACDRAIDIDGLQDLPLTEKDEIRLSQQAAYPFGNYLACPETKIMRLHRTSGTTGRALNLVNSSRDLQHIAEIGARAMFASGLRPADRVVHCLNYCLWTGGVTDHMALEGVGATVIPFGVGDSMHLIETIIDLGVTAISCTPSYPALLEQLLRQEGRNPRDLRLRLGLFGGEAGLDNSTFRATMEAVWGFGVRNANYGLSEVLSVLGSQCEATTDLHFHGADYLFSEILNPATGERLPIAEGTVGELVCTHIEKECQPLIRYRTRDVVTVTGTDPCACGRTSWRFRVIGRTDDMFNVRGINVFPAAVRAALLSRPELASGHYRIQLRGSGPYDRVRLVAEAADGVPPDRWPEVARALEEQIRHAVGASAEVRLTAFGSMPRAVGKTSWIERLPE